MGISLTKGQKISLTKADGSGAPTRIAMGLGWDADDDDEIDLDASCIGFAADKSKVETVYFGNLRGFGGAGRHSGDNLTGDGDGDDETIEVDLDKVPAQVTHLVFTVNSFRGQTFDEVANASCRLIDRDTGAELAKYNLSEKGSHTGLVLARLYRHQGAWKLHAMGEPGRGRTTDAMIPHIVTLF